jgi:hypothetical protein
VTGPPVAAAADSAEGVTAAGAVVGSPQSSTGAGCCGAAGCEADCGTAAAWGTCAAAGSYRGAAVSAGAAFSVGAVASVPYGTWLLPMLLSVPTTQTPGACSTARVHGSCGAAAVGAVTPAPAVPAFWLAVDPRFTAVAPAPWRPGESTAFCGVCCGSAGTEGSQSKGGSSSSGGASSSLAGPQSSSEYAYVPAVSGSRAGAGTAGPGAVAVSVGAEPVGAATGGTTTGAPTGEAGA